MSNVMGDSSTCLARSFSTPAEPYCAPQEGNPLRALGESISFGRYMSESLDWEKWSTFSHNRYVEEAEKYSKPGSVAAKKAYFEAHYKRKAAERAAALIKEANAQANRTFDSKTQEENRTDSNIQTNLQMDNIVTVNEQPERAAALIEEADAQANGTSDSKTQEENCTDSNIQTNLQTGNIVTVNIQPDQETVNYPVVDCADTKQYEHDCGESDLVVSNVEGAEDVSIPRVDTNLNAESCMLVDNSNQSDHVEVHENITVPVEETAPDDPGIAGQEVLASAPLKGREVNSLPKLSTKTTATDKLPHSLDERKVASKGKNKKPVVDTVEKKRLTVRSLRTSINLPSGIGNTIRAAAAASQSSNSLNRFSTSKKTAGGSVEKKKRITAPSLSMSIDLPSGSGVTSKTATSAVMPKNRMNFASKFIKSVGDSMEKRITAGSLHMSINLTSRAGEARKRDSVLEHNRIRKVHSNLPNPVASRTSTKASHGLLNQASANLPSQGRRTERLLNKSVSGSVTANAKLSSVSDGCLKSPKSTKSNPQSATISLPFRFRSEERAVKRKEFLQRMDENKSKEEEKLQLHKIPKGKTEHDHKKLRQSSSYKSKLNEDRPDGSQSPSSQIRKSSIVLPRSPKLGSKASSSMFHDKNSGNSWKPPISTRNSKRVKEKINRTERKSVTSLSNTTLENASPNIQN